MDYEESMDVSQPQPQRLAPQNAQAEACVIGAMIIESKAIPIAVDMLQAEDFYRPAHQILFATIKDMHFRQVGVDLVTLRAELEIRKQFDTVGGIDYLVLLVEGVPSAANVKYYAGIVRRCARSRDLIVLGQRLLSDGYDLAQDPAELIGNAQVELHELSLRCQDAKEDGPVSQFIEEAITQTEAIATRPDENRLMTGYEDVDAFSGGFLPGEVIVLGGRTSTGKSSFACNVAANVSLQGKSCLIVSGEMPGNQTARRMIQSMGHVWGSRFRQGNLSDVEWEYAGDAADAIKEWKMHVVGKPMTVPQIGMKVHQLESQWGKPVDFVVIDYLQIMKPHEGRTIREQIIAMTRDVKQMALERHTVVLLLSQFSRPMKDIKGKVADVPPTIYDLKESGSSENDADIVLLLHRPEPQPNQVMPRQDRSLEVWLRYGKGRDIGTTPWPDPDDMEKPGIRLRFWPGLTLFGNWMSPLDTVRRLQGKPKPPVTQRSKYATITEPMSAFVGRMLAKIVEEKENT